MDIKRYDNHIYDYMDVEFDKYSVDELIEQVDQDYPDPRQNDHSKKQMLSIMSQCDGSNTLTREEMVFCRVCDNIKRWSNDSSNTQTFYTYL